jgi:hypothetical protein
MALYKFNIKHTCESDKCHDNLQSKIESYLAKKILSSGHLSMNHVPNNHKVWLFLYDNPLKHESESLGKIVIQDSEFAKKWTGKTPILSELKELF